VKDDSPTGPVMYDLISKVILVYLHVLPSLKSATRRRDLKCISEMNPAEREEVLDLLCYSLDRQADHAALCSETSLQTMLAATSSTLRAIADTVSIDEGPLAIKLMHQAVHLLAKAQAIGPFASGTVH